MTKIYAPVHYITVKMGEITMNASELNVCVINAELLQTLNQTLNLSLTKKVLNLFPESWSAHSIFVLFWIIHHS